MSLSGNSRTWGPGLGRADRSVYYRANKLPDDLFPEVWLLQILIPF